MFWWPRGERFEEYNLLHLTTATPKCAYSLLSSLSPVQIPISTPRRLHPTLPTGRVHLRQPFHRTSPFTVTHEGGELLHVRKRLANGVEPTVEAGALGLRFRRPLEATLIVVALEFEILDEH